MRQLFVIVLLLFSVLTCFSQQSLSSKLTVHDGYWYLYSERKEIRRDGAVKIKDTYYSTDDFAVIMFEPNGNYTQSDVINKNQLAAKWKLIENDKVTIYQSVTDPHLNRMVDIVSLSYNKLVLRYSEEDGGVTVIKTQTYCFPDNRLLSDEALNLNAEVVNVTEKTKLEDNKENIATHNSVNIIVDTIPVLSVDNSLEIKSVKEEVVIEDITCKKIFQPSAASLPLIQRVLQAKYFTPFIHLDNYLINCTESLFCNFKGIKEAEIQIEGNSAINFLSFDEDGNLLSFNDDKVIYAYGLPVKIMSKTSESSIYYDGDIVSIEYPDGNIESWKRNLSGGAFVNKLWDKNNDLISMSKYNNGTLNVLSRVDGVQQETIYQFSNPNQASLDITQMSNTSGELRHKYTIDKISPYLIEIKDFVQVDGTSLIDLTNAGFGQLTQERSMKLFFDKDKCLKRIEQYISAETDEMHLSTIGILYTYY